MALIHFVGDGNDSRKGNGNGKGNGNSDGKSHISKPTKRQRWATQRMAGHGGVRKRVSIIERFHRRVSSREEKRKSADRIIHSANGPANEENDEVQPEPRKIYFNLPIPDTERDEDGKLKANYPPNKIRTSKYTPLTFIPKNLWLQFHNIANMYFLFVIIMGFFPIFGAANPGMNSVPLIVIIVVTAFKDAIEDWRRTVLDNQLNNSPVYRLVDWDNVNSTEDNVSLWRRFKKACTRGVIFLYRKAKSVRQKEPPEVVEDERRVSIAPRPSIYSYRASYYSTAGNADKEEIQMTYVPPQNADAHLPHQQNWPRSLTEGGESSSPPGRAAGDSKTAAPKKTGSILNRSKQTPEKARFKRDYWKSVRVGDFVRLYNGDQVPADIVILSTSDSDGACYVETKNLDGETNLKVRQALHCGRDVKHARDCEKTEFEIESEPPHPNLYAYSGAIHWKQRVEESPEAPMLEAISINNVLLRGCSLQNTEWVLGVVVYTGAETKIMLNSGSTPSKRPKLARELNRNVIYNFIILFGMCMVSGFVNGFAWAQNNASLTYFDFGSYGGSPTVEGIVSFWVGVILFQNLVPISLFISLEIVRTAQALFIYYDQYMFYEKLGIACIPKSWNISDDVGQVEYIFSDKTGTLTQNVMEFRKCTINGVAYGEAYTEAQMGMQKREGINVDEEAAKALQNIAEARLKMIQMLRQLYDNPYLADEELTFVAPDFVADLDGRSGPDQTQATTDFMIALALCHTVITERIPGDPPRIEFRAQSPDEAALVATARDCGFTVIGRSADDLILNVMGTERTYTVLNTLEFNSTRKRMSAIIRMPDGKIKLFCKGADSIIYSRLARGKQQELRRTTASHLEVFAREGLRTLCVAERDLSEEEYATWSREHDLAAQALNDREQRLEDVASVIEQELMLLGGTAIEDRLQDGVPDTISLLADAGIKLWVLTGDKVETAINIGFSCNLLTSDMDLIVFNIPADDAALAASELDKNLSTLGITGSDEELIAARLDHRAPSPRHALMLDDELMQKFLLLCKHPAQKAAVVRMVKNGLNVMALSIGDGANDVAMIQEADEGRQAFRFLQRLVLTTANFFYKNLVWTLALFWYSIFNNFDGSYLYDYTYIVLVNVAFTSLPVIFMGIFDQDVDDKVSLAVPQLYMRGIEQLEWSQPKFWLYMLDGLYQSVMCFFMPYLLFRPANFVHSNGMNINDRPRIGVLVASSAVLASNGYILLNTYRWDWLTVLINMISSLLIFFWTGVWSSVTSSGQFYKAAPEIYGALSFWVVLLLTVIICLLPRFAIKALQKVFFPRDVDIIREQVIQGEFKYLEQFEAYVPPKAADIGTTPDSELSAVSSDTGRTLEKKVRKEPTIPEDERPIYPPSVAPTATTHNPRSQTGSDGTNYAASLDLGYSRRQSLEQSRMSWDRKHSSVNSNDFTSAGMLARIISVDQAMEFVDAVRELQALPENIHLLCPRQHDDDHERYDGLTAEGTADERVADLIVKAKTRKEKFLSCMQILAFSQDGVEELQHWIWRKLDDTLEKCDICIKEYYTGKLWLVEKLKENYDDEDIDKFARMLDEWDIKRITRNLTTAEEKLKAVPSQDIGLHILDRASLLSIFESLSCEAILRNDALLKQYFDLPFKLIQTKRTLKVSDYIPAVTYFLFDPDQNRSFWAINAWSRYSRPPTLSEFDWAVKEGLLRALGEASQQPPDIGVVQRLWRGLQLIVKRLDKEQITHNLRALEVDACRLSVEHLAIPTPGLRFLLNTIQILLEKAPGDFWDAMQTISPQAIIEQVFYNPQLDAFLMQASDSECFDKSTLKDMLSWITPFMLSLKGAHQPSACRFLVFQLLNRFQDARFPNAARYHCFRTGLTVLLHTLRSFTDHESSRGSVARIVLSETLEVVSDNINQILEPPIFAVDLTQQKEITSLCLDVVRNTLALECQSLKRDYEVILREKTLHHRVSTHSPAIWDAVIQHMRDDNEALSTATLLGILPLVGLEKFSTKGEGSQEKNQFNIIYCHLTHLSCQIIERLADFGPEHLNNLFSGQDTNSALISTLFSADLNTYQAAVDLIKGVSGQSARRDAISHLLRSFFLTTMYGLSWSFRRISNMKTFASAPRMIHTGTDIVDTLCDTENGILRTRKLTDRKEALALQRLWEYQWQALTTIFDETEAWHLRGNDKSVMLEFCRDTIQFADLLFDQYSVFASAIVGVDLGQEKSARENLLKSPTATMSGMVKWLRLKDEYLATTLIGLVAKLLRRLGELNVTTVKEDALNFIEGVAVKSTVKTILTPREKAELVRALEAYYKRPVITASTAVLKKQTRITAFTRPVDFSGTTTPSGATSDDAFDDSSVPDEVLIQLSRSVELNKARLASQAQKKAESTSKESTPIAKPARASVANIESFREKREKEKEAKRKRDLAELVRLKKSLPPRGVAEQTAGQGSGLNGIGVKGKDHTPAESMMVSSGSESDSETDDDFDKELFGRKSKSKPDAVREYEESRKRFLKQQGPVKKVKQLRSAKDMRARLAPDLSSLHRTLLNWDFFAGGDLPPNSERTDYTLVSNVFRDPIEYQKTFEPLLVLEAWQGFQSAKEDSMFKSFEIKVNSRLSVDSFIEVSTVMQVPDIKDLGLGEADIVLLSKSKTPATDAEAPHCLARVCGINKKKGNVEVTYRVNPGISISSSLSPGVTIWGARITSLTPLEREYGALMALQYYDLCEEVIKAKPSPILNYSDAILKPIAENYKVNPAQAKAVKSALDNDAFTLIQGPPGSGKTKTIVALVGALLTNYFDVKGVTISRPSDVSHFEPATRTTPSKKLLVCAPSNAAVDELVMRFKEGVKSLHGNNEKLSVIRLGRSDAINAKVLDVTLDELVSAKIKQFSRKDAGERDLQKIYMEHKAADTAFKETRSKIDQCRAQGQPVAPELEREFDLLKKKKTLLSQEIDTARDKNHSAARNAELTRRRIQQGIIDGAHVICATLSGSGHDMFQNLSIEFETVIIDEAAQSIELSALIPLKYGCSRCILVGDPKQLPPTVLSKEASRFQYEQSLFVRMQANHPKDVHLLDVQYRMHPEISRFPRAAFYDDKLSDGPDMAKLRNRPWHESVLLSPYRFFDVQGLHQSASKGHSLINIAEVRVAMKLYERLTTDFGEYDFSGKIGIITPYKGQLKELKSQFASRYGNSIFTAVEFNTTDAFQGRESEVIIFSCVRASNRGIGFLADIRRMNVGLTRAKSSLWVLGNSQSLLQGEFWKNLIVNARERNLYTDGDVLRILQRPQFTGYKNVEMVDAYAEVSLPELPSRAPSASSLGSLFRAPSTSFEGRSPKDLDLASIPASATNTPPVLPPDGPSGGPTVIQVTTKSPPPKGEKNFGLSKVDGQGLGKRRRTVSPPTEKAKMGGEKNPESAGSTPTSKNSRRKLNVLVPQPTTDLVKPSRDGPAFQPIANQTPPAGTSQDPGGQVLPSRPPPPPVRQGLANGVRPPPPIRRRKEVDPFIRPRRR
ncbi:SEN1 N terminal domain containing protein [Elaphomyces granulatus]